MITFYKKIFLHFDENINKKRVEEKRPASLFVNTLYGRGNR